MSNPILYASNGDIDINGFGHYLLPMLPGNYELIASAEEALNEDDGDPDFTPEIGDTYTYRKVGTQLNLKVTVIDNAYLIDLFADDIKDVYSDDVSSQGKITGCINELMLQYEEVALAAQVGGLIAQGKSHVTDKPKLKL